MKCFIGGLLNRGLRVLVGWAVLSTGLAGNVYAIKVDDKYVHSDIVFYDPTGGFGVDRCGTLDGSYDGIATIGLSDLQSAFVDKYYPFALKYGLEYGIPWETPMAQGILESGAGSSELARERNNFFGIGAFDSNPDNAFRYETPEKGWEGYYKNIKNTSVYASKGAFNYPKDPYGYLKAIATGYATDENYANKITKLIRAVELRAEIKGYKLSRDDPGSDPNIASEFPGNVFCGGIDGGVIKNGGFSVEQARKFMQKYGRINSQDYGFTHYKSCQSALANCVAFVKYFLKDYTNLPLKKSVDFSIGNGRDVAANLATRYSLEKGRTPRPFAVFSIASGDTLCYGVPCGHTGVVLGVHGDKVITGEAFCDINAKEESGVRERTIQSMMEGKRDKKGNVAHYEFVYLDEILKGVGDGV